MEQSTSPLREEDASQRPGVLQKLSSLFRTYAIPEESIIVPGPFIQGDRSCYHFKVPEVWPSDADGLSKVRLLEDGQYLGPAAVSHDDIRTLGRGRYSHWGAQIYFSSSDSSDPNTNGRVYSLVPPSNWQAPEGATQWADYAARKSNNEYAAVTMEWATEEIAPASMKSLGGCTFAIELRENWPSDDASLSTLLLLENDTPLQYPHATHDEIEKAGCNAYGHWGSKLLFAASDGSDPRSNDRRYSLAYAKAFLFEQARQQPVSEQGRCWILDGLPPEWPSDQDGSSNVRLLEDGKLLGPAHSNHDDLRKKGEGRYCHWGDQLWFSTSDGSDPITNGRTYTVVWRAHDDEPG